MAPVPRSLRQALSNALANWRASDRPPLRKLGLTVRNNARKLRTGEPCCGHPGEPGC